MLTSTQSPREAVRYWRDVCRDHALIRGQMKMAELGGGQDTPFEQAFSNLAHAYIKDKAPKLLDFEVGFQLLEKNQENTKAVGVFGFKIGSQWVYVPVFFLNGDLKGHELLYIKSQDQFLPLKENWINHILGKKPSVLGDGVNRNLSQLGIMPPNLYQLSRSPYKFASAEKAAEGGGLSQGSGYWMDRVNSSLGTNQSVPNSTIPGATPAPAGGWMDRVNSSLGTNQSVPNSTIPGATPAPAGGAMGRGMAQVGQGLSGTGNVGGQVSRGTARQPGPTANVSGVKGPGTGVTPVQGKGIGVGAPNAAPKGPGIGVPSPAPAGGAGAIPAAGGIKQSAEKSAEGLKAGPIGPPMGPGAGAAAAGPAKKPPLKTITQFMTPGAGTPPAPPPAAGPAKKQPSQTITQFMAPGAGTPPAPPPAAGTPAGGAGTPPAPPPAGRSGVSTASPGGLAGPAAYDPSVAMSHQYRGSQYEKQGPPTGEQAAGQAQGPPNWLSPFGGRATPGGARPRQAQPTPKPGYSDPALNVPNKPLNFGGPSPLPGDRSQPNTGGITPQPGYKYSSDETQKSIVRRAHTEEDEDVDAPDGGTVVRMSHDEADPDAGIGENVSVDKTGGLKIASWALDFLPVLGYLTMVPPSHKYGDAKGFADLVKEGGEETLRYIVEKIGTTYPSVIQSIDQIYGPELLTNAAREAARMRKAAASKSLVKEAVVSSAGEHPKGWNGGIKPPTKKNGGKMSTGGDAWDSTHEQDGGLSRRFEKKHGGAEKGKLGDLFKMSNYPGCGMRPKRPKKMKKKGDDRSPLLKAASIIPSILGPLMSGDLKHKVVSRDMVDNDPNIVHDMKSDEKETLLKERVVMSDKRDDKDVTIAYDVQTPLKLTNPDHTGVYYVLCRPDKFEKCIVIMSPYSSKQRHNFATVIRFDGKQNYTNTHPANIWVRAEFDRDEWTKWWESIDTDANNIPLAPKEKRWDYRTRYVLLGPSGQGTCPFMATEKYTGDKNSSIVYEVDWEDHNYSSRPAYLPDHGENMRDPYMHGGHHTNCNQVVLTKRPGIKMTCLRGQLLVPSEFKLIKVKDEKGENESNNEPVQLGNLLDVQLAIMANTQPIRIVLDGKDVKVDDERMDKTSALVHLFRDHGLREKAARYLINKAEKDGRSEARLAYPQYIQDQWDLTEKLADNDMISGAPNSPSFPEPYYGYDPMTGGNVPTMMPSEFNQKIPDMSASKTDRSIFYPFGPDPKAMQVAQQASQSGQKEIFDTAMLGGLLKAVRQDNIVDKYMGDLKKGLDRLGRILFLYYWHGEEFKDRYGKQDMPELEDGLRNGFENVGDIVLKLMQKTIEASPDEGTGVDLGAIANQ